MKYYTARQHNLTGLWHFTANEGGKIEPVGYCAEGCPGHKTADEAMLHYAEYLLDTHKVALRNGDFRLCQVCAAPTNHTVLIGDKRFHLCSDHQDVKTLLRFYPMESLVQLHKREPQGRTTRIILTP